MPQLLGDRLLLITAKTEEFELHSVLGIYTSLKSAKCLSKAPDAKDVPIGGLFIYAHALEVDSIPDSKDIKIGQIDYGDDSITWTAQ